MIRKIIRMGHPNLRKIAQPYPQDQIGSGEFRDLIEDLRETLMESGGIGLAAPQINVPYRLVVIDTKTSKSRYGDLPTIPVTTYINPVVTVLDDNLAGVWEGCLSIPKIRGFVERPQNIRVDWIDETGLRKTLKAQGLLATVFQHEFDHLNGVLFIDRVQDKSKISFDDEFDLYHQPTEQK
ncbi:MAG: peptide deformylase [Gammaproteobacteria bacterium TMED1]|jgi:peptide deformylase|nr:MAG: peptide deformylase [Gammaproteobacteria bacterium TMED1]|tara:strand:+ start:969 stop:1511 length:543 start_codon:yes stop_codon:yes gene_type:complete